MSERLDLSDAAIEAMLVRRARRADPGDLAQVALDAIWRTPPRSARPWDGLLVASPRLASGSARWLWVAIAGMLALALVGGLLGVGASRLLERPYPLLTGAPDLNWISRQGAVSGDELWTVGDAALWHYIGGAWQGPLRPPPLASEDVSGFALGPDGALWVAGYTMVAVLRDGAWSLAWTAPPPSGTGLRGLVVAPDGTVWVGRGHELVGLRREGAGYSARSVECPWIMSRMAVTTDGTVYVGSFAYSDGPGGLARSDGTTCAFVDALGDGKVHQIADLAAGPAGSLLANVFDQDGQQVVSVTIVQLRDGRWSKISDPAVDPYLILGLAIAPDGHPWRIDRDRGLERYSGAAWRMIAPSARSLALAPDGVLWYETDRGLERIRTDTVGG